MIQGHRQQHICLVGMEKVRYLGRTVVGGLGGDNCSTDMLKQKGMMIP